ncbi:uncharacterized protein LOC108598017 [Drosophila busckii]|uniref:uncharacterized protein LOC108598017 n=1 Tax=Drosophila busckii TaxID=30019 RepID=UPI00083F216D|nr:uncharacterized protein LOC108598017 [Drosophila busckii]
MLLEFLVLSSAAPPYAYGVQTDPEHGKICSGKYLNPINYADANIVENTFHNLTFHGWEVIPDNMQIINNGQTVVLKMDFRQGQDPKVYLGPIKTEAPYDLDHLYFYFLEPEPYPSELHVIMRRLEGHDEDFGLAVLAFSILPSQYYNAPYDELTQSLEFIQGIGDTAHLMKRMSIRSFVSQDLDTYYSYEGSLITSCSKRVLWVDFVDPIDVLSYQVRH